MKLPLFEVYLWVVSLETAIVKTTKAEVNLNVLLNYLKGGSFIYSPANRVTPTTKSYRRSRLKPARNKFCSTTPCQIVVVLVVNPGEDESPNKRLRVKRNRVLLFLKAAFLADK